MTTTYPAAGRDAIYYRRDGGWWVRHPDAPHGDAQAVLLLDVLVGVESEYRSEVVATHERAITDEVLRLHGDIREGRTTTVRSAVDRLGALADDALSVRIVERAR